MRTCRVCGCSDENACISERYGSCWWSEDDLCSACDPAFKWGIKWGKAAWKHPRD